MSKHTPGPWTFGHWGNDFWIGTDKSGLSGKVARVIWDMGEAVEEGRENARLIAAAPDMYAALCAVNRHFGAFEYNPMLHPDVQKVFELCREAIVKAGIGADD
jgi:hypothetical protein